MKDMLLELAVAFLLVVAACYSSINLYRITAQDRCIPTELREVDGQQVLFSVCRTLL